MSSTPASTPSSRSRALIVVLVVLALIGGGAVAWTLADDRAGGRTAEAPSKNLTPVPEPSPTAPVPATDPALAAFYDQKLDWKDCGGDRCAVLRVPLDYAKPRGAEIEIAVLKSPSSEPADRIGSLVVNPGGPGGSGVEFARAGSSQFGSELTRYYDIVGFDPRGVGASRTLRCLSTQGLDDLMAYDPDPDTPAEVAGLDSRYAAFGQGCLTRSGAIVRHMSTREAARDMDVLRAALGERKLDYLGSSYGTLLGATYADLFPTNVGRFVLDGAIDPSLSTVDLSVEQARGFEVALRAYVADCVADGDCFLGTTVDAGIRKIQGLLDELDARPLPGDGDRRLTEGLGMMGVYMPLYVRSYWVLLTQALKAAFAGDGSGLLQLSDYQTSRGKDGYDGNLIEALNAVNCLDHGDYITSAQVPRYVARFEKASPTFGRAFAYGAAACSSWPVKSGQRTVALVAPGAPPIVVIGTTRDPATPLVWARAMAAQLDSGRLITRDGDGHTGFGRGSACVDDAVERFLVEGKVPKRDLRCR
ncbi:MAG: alpha/beta hydrolase [Propionibacteriales bacterium]|nr:alpha/beta hydrolase [Propionibacteriales bacterium]